VRMAEILGGFASAAQLTQCALQIKAAISTIHSRVRDASELAEYATQIKQLIDTAVSIQHNCRLHTSPIIRHLDSAITEAESSSIFWAAYWPTTQADRSAGDTSKPRGVVMKKGKLRMASEG
jgi:hypothetical protein